jgi:hypothetical protein
MCQYRLLCNNLRDKKVSEGNYSNQHKKPNINIYLL